MKISRRLKRLFGDSGANTPGPLDDFLEKYSKAVSRGDGRLTKEIEAEYRRFILGMEEAASPQSRGRSGVPLELGSGIQSKQFMIDLLPHIQRFVHAHERRTTLSVLDVGAGTGHGTNLLASLYARMELGYRLKVTALDIRDTYKNYIRTACRFVNFVQADVYSLEETYDIVIASHVVEHVRKAVPFVERLQQCATGVVFLSGPFEEPEENLTKGHCHSLGQDFLEQLDTSTVHVIESRAWGNFLSPPYKMFIAELPGRGRKVAKS